MNYHEHGPRWQRWLRWLADGGSSRSIGYYLAAPFLLMWYAVRGVAVALAGAWQSWLGRHLLMGLPAVLAAAGVFTLAAVYTQSARPALSLKYRAAAAAALESGDHQRALTSLQRLRQLEGDTDENRYLSSLAWAGLGDQRRAELLLRAAAPTDRPGDPSAHLEMAKRFLADEKTAAAQTHLLLAAMTDPNRSDVQAALGQLYFADGRHDLAVPRLEAARAAMPELNVLLAEIARQRGEPRKVASYARAARDHFAARLAADPFDHRSRIQQASALILLGEYERALTSLSEGHRLSEDPVYRQLIGQTMAAWADSRDRLGDKLRILERGLKNQPDHPALLDRLAAIAGHSGEDADRARREMRRLLAEGHSPAQLHFLLGIDAARRGVLSEAEVHLKWAWEKNPDLPVVANNLAWVMTQQDDGDHEYALKLADFAVERVPDQLRFRETRGQCLLLLGRWEEARADLQASLPAQKQNPTTHDALAEAYEHLKLPEMAAEHRAIAASLREGSSKE